MSTLSIDRHDLALLDALQRSGDATNAVLGEAVHLSASQVSRRLQRLQEAGLITGYAALLDPAALGLDVIAFAHVVLERHGGVRTEAFEEGVAVLPEVLLLAGLGAAMLRPAAVPVPPDGAPPGARRPNA